MSDKQFTHVCTSCHAPAFLQKTKGSILNMQTVFLIALIIVATALFNFIGFILGVTGAFLWAFNLNRKRLKTCTSCHSATLIPVATPEGMRIMKEHGWVES